jgi:hypothetical protein
MGIVRYLRWRFSPQGRAAYKSYAQGRAEARQLARPPRYNSRKARAARAQAAIERSRQAPRMTPSRVTDLWTDGRTRVTDFDTRSGRKVRVHETRPRAKDRDGLRPRQRRVRG